MIAKDASFAEAVAELAGETLAPDPRPAETAPGSAKSDSGYERRQHVKAAWLWHQRKPIAGTISERYLRGPRAYCGPLPATLGFLLALKAEQQGRIDLVGCRPIDCLLSAKLLRVVSHLTAQQ